MANQTLKSYFLSIICFSYSLVQPRPQGAFRKAPWGRHVLSRIESWSKIFSCGCGGGGGGGGGGEGGCGDDGVVK